MGEKQTYHLNDRTMKYLTLAQTKRQHQYLGLPGEFKTRLPQEIVFPNMEFGRVDEYYYNNKGMLINLEEESGEITTKTLEKFAKYIIFASYQYTRNVLLVVICHKNPKKEFECFKCSPSIYIKVCYFYISQKELWDKYENVINKVKQKEKLTEMEALDIAFISKFVSSDDASKVVESLTRVFEHAKIEDKLLKIDIGVILGGMILKHFEDVEKQDKLLGRINMRHIEKEIDKLVYDEYGDILDKKDEEISKLNKSNKEYRDKIRQLNELGDLNSPEAKKIINSLLLL